MKIQGFGQRAFLLVLFAAGFLWQIPTHAEPGAGQHEFVGSKKCATCHKSEEQGRQYILWQESKHAKAYQTLATPEAKTVGQARGVADPQTSPKCLKCHSTAYALSEARVTEAVDLEEGVSCESCHGAGADYKKKSVMKDKAASVAAGLVIPEEAVCRKCHNETSPTYKPFDFAERSKEIAHPRPRV